MKQTIRIQRIMRKQYALEKLLYSNLMSFFTPGKTVHCVKGKGWVAARVLFVAYPRGIFVKDVKTGREHWTDVYILLEGLERNINKT